MIKPERMDELHRIADSAGFSEAITLEPGELQELLNIIKNAKHEAEVQRKHANEGWTLCNHRTVERTKALAALHSAVDKSQSWIRMAIDVLEETKYICPNIDD